MQRLKISVLIAALTVMIICIYTFLLGNEIFAAKFTNNLLSWYFLAKGVFCFTALYLLVLILEALKKKNNQNE